MLSGLAQLRDSTFCGGANDEFPYALVQLGSGALSVAGTTCSLDYPTTTDAFARTLYLQAFIADLGARNPLHLSGTAGGQSVFGR